MKLTFILFVLAFRGTAQLPVIVHEKFDVNTYGWHEVRKPSVKVFFTDGKYFIDAPDGGWISYIGPYLDPAADFSLEATFTQLEGMTNNGMGLLWGHNGKDRLNSFTITSGGRYRIGCSEPALKISDEWRESRHIRPLGSANTLKVVQFRKMMSFFVNGALLATAKACPWRGKYLGFIAFTRMKVLVDDFILSQDIRINLPRDSEPPGARENLGPGINTVYDEVSPKISADGKTLYFGRKLSPHNVGGRQDKEDIWWSRTADGITWSPGRNLGPPVNTPATNNLVSVSADNNTMLFHVNEGFALMHRTATSWSPLQDIGLHFDNESDFLEGCLSSDGKAIIFVAKFKDNAFYRRDNAERDIYVSVKMANGKWSAPIHTGNVLNSAGNEYSPFLSADGRTLYFATNGRPGYGGVDVFMSRRLTQGWQHWSEPVNLGLGINTVGFDAYYSLPASGEYGYMVTNTNTAGRADIIRFRLPASVRPDPVVLVAGRVLHDRTGKPLPAMIRFDDLRSGKEIGEARVDPKTGDYRIVLPAGRNYGFHAAAPGYLSVNENLELSDLKKYGEIRKDLFLVPIEIGEAVRLRNVFFVQSNWELMPASYPELDRLAKIMMDNPKIEIELSGHTDSRGSAEANFELSLKRAGAVKEYLVKKGIDEKRITSRGYGGSRTIAPGDTEENRQLNRRVEFKIIKK